MYRIGKEEIDAAARAIYSKDFLKINSSGCEVLNFESELKEYTGSDYCLLMSSGFGAITSALICLGIGPGDEVIVPAYTYIATALAVTAVGAIPVIADIDDTLTLDPAEAEKKISKRTKAIIPVHIQGFPCDLDALIQWICAPKLLTCLHAPHTSQSTPIGAAKSLNRLQQLSIMHYNNNGAASL